MSTHWLSIFDTALCMALLYTACAVICIWADTSKNNVATPTANPWPLWRWCAIVLLALAVNALLQLELVFLFWVREFAKDSGWYELRRPIQIGVLLWLVGAITLVPEIRHKVWRTYRKSSSTATAMVALGLVLLVGLFVLRFVSLHYTDQVLDWQVMGRRLGRLAEFSGLGLVMLGGALHILGIA